ncbi:MAG TPA: FABP family protein [Acidimicrobiales bacterium]
MSAVHPDLGPLARLLGTWAGEGEGRYPTIEPFRYREEAVFSHVGKPFVAYRQSTTNLATEQPAHAEAGYLRAVAPGRVELVLVHPTGIVELAAGDVLDEPDGVALHLASTTVLRTPTAKEVTKVERRISVSGDTLRYQVAMAAVGMPLQHHLSAELHRR